MVNTGKLLVAQNLAISRGTLRVVEGVYLTISSGDIVIIRGANGSGKTTLLRALAGLLPIETGSISIGGLAPENARLYCGPLNAVKPALSVDENLRFWAALYRAPPHRINAARAEFGLDHYAASPAAILSTGFARRLALSRLLIAGRPLWFVDEPSAGLDAISVETFTNAVSRHCASGGAAVIATHDPLPFAGSRELEMQVP